MTNITTQSDQPSATGGAASSATDRAAGVAGTAADEAKSVASTAAEQAKETASQAAQQARDLAGEARQQLRSQVDQQSERVVSTLGDVSRQLRSMADSADQGSPVADLARQAAERTEAFTQRLQQGGVESMLGDVKRFARNQPGMFLLGAAAAGFAIGRVVRTADAKRAVEAAKEQIGSGASTGSVSGQGTQDLAMSGTVAGSPMGGSVGVVGAPTVPPAPAATTEQLPGELLTELTGDQASHAAGAPPMGGAAPPEV